MFTLPASIRRGARLDAVVSAVAAASGKTRFIYVERRGSLFRWSPAHRGGPYPLLRETAKLLEVEYHRIILPFGPVPTNPPARFDSDGIWRGLCFVPADESVGKSPADSWTVLEFDAPQPVEEVRARIRAALTPALS